MTLYAKAIVTLLGGVSSWGVTAAPNGIDSAEWFGLLAVLATAVAVFAVPNKPADDKGEVTLALLFVVGALVCAFGLIRQWPDPHIWAGFGVASAALAAATGGIVLRK